MRGLGARIECWRPTRQKRWPKSEPLWEGSVALPRRHGVDPVADAESGEGLAAAVAEEPLRGPGVEPGQRLYHGPQLLFRTPLPRALRDCLVMLAVLHRPEGTGFSQLQPARERRLRNADFLEQLVAEIGSGAAKRRPIRFLNPSEYSTSTHLLVPEELLPETRLATPWVSPPFGRDGPRPRKGKTPSRSPGPGTGRQLS